MAVLFIPSLVILFCLIGLSWFAGSDAPFVATKSKKIREVLKTVGVSQNNIFYELGSGDGRVVIDASILGAQSFGIEQSWIRVWYSRYRARKLKLKNASFFHGDIFDRNYYPADIVYIYLLSNAVQKLEKKLKEELKKGSVVITQTYHFKKWKPYQKLGDFYLYRV